jgi:hypothetical protein
MCQIKLKIESGEELRTNEITFNFPLSTLNPFPIFHFLKIQRQKLGGYILFLYLWNKFARNVSKMKKTVLHKSLFCVAFFALWLQASAQTAPPAVAEKEYAAYLFTYFTGNDNTLREEAIRLAISNDGYTYLALNKNQPVIDSKTVSSTGGLRDPHILRGEDGKTFYMVATDMVSAKGWDSNRAMVLFKSDDLIRWTSTVINIQQKYKGQEDLKRVWAPQTIYDSKAGKYMVYWSMKHGNGADIIYYAYTNKDFTDLEGEPKQLFFPKNGTSCIDGDVVLKDGTYYLFYKTEGQGNGIKLATTTSLTSGKWEEKEGYKQQINEAVEGSSVFKLINTDTYILMYDVYMKGKYQFTKSTDLENFTIIDKEIFMNFHPRHGTIIPITRKELDILTTKWGIPNGFSMPVIPGISGDTIR